MGNPSINRRRILLGLAAASTAVVTVGATVATAATTKGQASPKLLALAAAFEAEWAKLRALMPGHTIAEQAVIDAKPERPVSTPYSDELTERIRGMAVRDVGDENHPVVIEQRALYAKDAARRAVYDAEVKAIEKRLGWKKINQAYEGQVHRAGRAADRVLYLEAKSLADLAVKARVHRTWEFDASEALDVFARDIERIARKAAQS